MLIARLTIWFFCLTVAWLASPLPIHAADQSLYLLTGATHGSQSYVAVQLLRADTSGIALVRTILDEFATVPCGMSISPQDRLATVVIDGRRESFIDEIDMDNPLRSVRVKVDYGLAPGRYRTCMSSPLVRTPDGRLLQAIELGNDLPDSETIRPGESRNIFEGVQIRPLANNPKTEQLLWEDYARAEFSSVGWGNGRHGLETVRVGGLGVLSILSWRPAPVPARLDAAIQKQLPPDPNADAYQLEVNNSDWLVLMRAHFNRPVSKGLRTSFHDVLDKHSGSWSTLEVPGSDSIVKNFGAWLAATVIEGNSTRESPGKAHRRSVDDRNFALDFALEEDREYSPGTLFLVNAKTRQPYTIQTGEGDSEVLLIENGVVYYRVNDSVYSAAMSPDKINAPVLLGTKENIRDAHWAFLGPSASPDDAVTEQLARLSWAAEPGFLILW